MTARIFVFLFFCAAVSAADYHAGKTPDDLASAPSFTVNWAATATPAVDLSGLLPKPAGKGGFIRTQNGRLAYPDGQRFRIWGFNVTGAAGLPAKDDAPRLARRLAAMGINCLRFHMLDRVAPGGLIAAGRNDTRSLDPQQLDRLDWFIAALKEQGIYTDLNLNVGRTYKAGDGVKDYEYLGFAKSLTFFDPRLLELQREYARQVLTHTNAYTGLPYTREPAVALVEFVNENSLVEAWMDGRLRGLNTQKNPGTWSDITAAYAADLDALFNAWLRKNRPAEMLAGMRAAEGLAGDAPIPRLAPAQFAKASRDRFHAEAEFYLEVERDFYLGLARYLREELDVKALLAGNSDHGHYKTGLPQLAGIARLDVVDSHVYWQHPNYVTDAQSGKRSGFTIANTPMVDDPLMSTVVQLSRSAFAAQPFTVSEVGHPFPNEYACEGIPILAAYGALQDWDGIFWYTLAHQPVAGLPAKLGGHFDHASDPVKMAQIPAGALMFLRADVQKARTTVERTYTPAQVRESIRLSNKERPYFTPGFPRDLPLRHGSRIRSLDGPLTGTFEAIVDAGIQSDTGELAWRTNGPMSGLVSVDTERSQALIGFVGARRAALKNLAVDAQTPFCAITLSAVENQPIARSGRILLTATARLANSQMAWNAKRNSLEKWGDAPTRIEPVRATVALLGLGQAKSVTVIPLDGAGIATGQPFAATQSGDEWRITLSAPSLSYLITVSR